MKKTGMTFLLLIWAGSCLAGSSGHYELATNIENIDDTVKAETLGYAKLNLVRMPVNHSGRIFLKGTFSVNKGMVNIVMWSQVDGKYYFSRLPGLQGFSRSDDSVFSIPFSSPEHEISEVILSVEFPDGGELYIKNLELIKQ